MPNQQMDVLKYVDTSITLHISIAIYIYRKHNYDDLYKGEKHNN